MSKIEGGNFFDVPHSLVEYENEGRKVHLLWSLNGSDLKLYLALRHLANRFSSNRFYYDDVRLKELTGLSRTQLWRARNKLKAIGAISYKKEKFGDSYDYEITIVS